MWKGGGGGTLLLLFWEASEAKKVDVWLVPWSIAGFAKPINTIWNEIGSFPQVGMKIKQYFETTT